MGRAKGSINKERKIEETPKAKEVRDGATEQQRKRSMSRKQKKRKARPEREEVSQPEAKSEKIRDPENQTPK